MSERSSDIGKIIFAPWRAFLDLRYPLSHLLGFPGNPADKESTCNAGDPGLIPGSGRPAGEEIGYPFQDSWASLVAQMVRIHLQCGRPRFGPCWENPLEKGTASQSSILAWQIPWTEEPVRWQSIVSKSQTQLSDFHFTYMYMYIFFFLTGY